MPHARIWDEYPNPMRVGSLFTGYGGLDMAVEQHFGARTVWACDNDPGATRIIAHRMPGVPNLGDITKIDWSAMKRGGDAKWKPLRH